MRTAQTPLTRVREFNIARLVATKTLWFPTGMIVVFNALLAIVLLIKPGTHDQLVAVDDLAQTVGPLLMVPLCFWGAGKLWQQRRSSSAFHSAPISIARLWVPLLLGLCVLSFTIGQGIWTYYEQTLREATPFPSWADAGYLSAYPFLLLGILLLSTQPMPISSRTRVLFDGLMIMTALVTLSWYFILGPTVLQGGETVFAKIVGTAYPSADLVIIFCLVLLSFRSRDVSLRPVTRVLAVALTIIVITDSVTLQETYATGGLIDIGWPLGYMLVGLAAHMFRLIVARKAAQEATEQTVTAPVSPSDRQQFWQSVLPYLLILVVGMLAVALQYIGDVDTTLRNGVYVGGAILTALVVFRQILAIRETIGYNTTLHSMHEQLQQKNHALGEANARLEALATTDPLTGLPNHRALVTDLDQELERAQRYQRSCSILFLDIDHFKAINDGFGHSAGDIVLREFASIISSSLRGIDTVGRWGGEEFIVILPETNRSEIESLAERIRKIVAAHAFSVGGGLRLTCSLGIATYPYDAAERDALLEAADKAMYCAKKLGRNQARAIHDPAVKALLLEEDKPNSREDTALIGMVEALKTMANVHDNYTAEHSQRVSTMALQLALQLGMDTSEAQMIALAGQLHDIGKFAIPESILQKPTPLSEEEWELIRKHPATGAAVVNHVPSLRAIAPMIRAHHERWDGHGYPDGLAHEAIPLGARIIAVVEAYDVLTTDKPYQPSLPTTQALIELRRCAGTQFDTSVVEVLEQILVTDAMLAGNTL